MLQPRKSAGKLATLPISQVTPSRHQPRKVFEESSLRELSDSIRSNGLLQPITVRQLARGEYELVAGERRLRAAAMAGLTSIPALIVDMPDCKAAVMALVENLQRRDLDCFEEAEGLARLLTEQELTQEQAAAMLGKTQSTIANKLRLLRLEPELRQRIREAGLTERHARALLRLPDPLRPEALEQIISRRLTVAAAERLVERLLAPPAPQPRKKGVVKDVRLFLNTVEQALNLMKNSGICATSEMTEHDSCYEYYILIPK